MDQETLKEIGKNFDVLLDINCDREICDYDYLFIWSPKKTKTIRLPKNVTKEWIIKQINKLADDRYRNLCDIFKKLDIKGDIYYTSFGLSYCMFCKDSDRFKKDVSTIQQKLNTMGIEYKNEFSEAYWVYRFRISQKADNLAKIL